MVALLADLLVPNKSLSTAAIVVLSLQSTPKCVLSEHSIVMASTDVLAALEFC